MRTIRLQKDHGKLVYRTIRKMIPERKHYFKSGMIPEEKRDEIFSYWMIGFKNTYPEMSRKFGCSVHQIKWVLEKKLKDRRNQKQIA